MRKSAASAERALVTGGGEAGLVIVGAGGFARETIEAVRAVNAERPSWHLLGILDDSPALAGTVVGGLPVLGPVEMVRELPDASVVICTGRPDNYVSRPALAARLGLPDERYATIVHPSSRPPASVSLGAGTVVLAQVALTADVTVGRHVAVMPQTVLTHDDVVGDWATLASGVRLGGSVAIGRGAYIGSAVCVRNGLAVGDWAMVGMGSVVTRDVPSERLWYGSPARDKARAPVPPDIAGMYGAGLRPD